jgi:translation initiation factor IF-2
MRVYELARELGLESKEVLERAVELGIDAKTASSGLDDDSAALIKMSYEEAAAPAPPPGDDGVEPEPVPAPGSEPVPAPGSEPVPVPAEPRSGRARAPRPVPEEPALRPLKVTEGITVEQFAREARRPMGLVVKGLIDRGQMAGASQPIPTEFLAAVAADLGYQLEVVPAVEEEKEAPAPLVRAKAEFDDDPADLVLRPPVVTVMGHVDHGKTKLLDAIRTANVVAGEAGGITQHIGAYQVERAGRKLTFIDTPGHEAFTTLRARGAEVTDIVVLVVAADDGVMPQTVEAISHAKAARVPIIVAINKIDLPAADPHQVRAQLTEHGLVVESLGGDVVAVELSALEGLGIDDLLEYIDLISEVEGFSANPGAEPSGTVIEAQLDKGRGPVATVIVQRGTMRRGDALVAGPVSGRVRAMFDENGRQVEEAGPSTPVLVMGWDDVPRAGDRFRVVTDHRQARQLADDRIAELRLEEHVVPTAVDRLQALIDDLRSRDHAELRLVVKTDAHGSLEAIRDGVQKIERDRARITMIHGAVGGINENDVVLAEAAGALILGFNVRPDGKTRRAAESAAIEIRTYRIIYELLDDIEALLVGRLAPEEVETVLGVAEVRATFRAPRFGFIAGCYVTEGSIPRGGRVRLLRDGVVVYDGRIGSLRRFKDDVPSVAAGFECGIGLENFRDVKEGDHIEAYEVREVART